MPLTLPRTVLILLFACGFAACRVDRPDDDGEDRLLEDLMEVYISARFDFYPVESTLAGLPGNDDRLGSFARVDIERRVRWLSDYRQKLTGLRPRFLSQAAHMDELWLTSLVKAELFELEERALWKKTASFYAEPIRTGIVSLLLSEDLPAKTGALAGRLDEVPALIEHARENLVSDSPLWAEDGIASLERSRALLQSLPLLLEERLPSYRVADLAERSRGGVRAIQSLLALLTVSSPASDGEDTQHVLGADALGRLLRYREMVDWPLDDLLAMANEALETHTNALTDIALEELSGAPLRDLLSNEELPEPDENAAKTVADKVRRELSLPEPVEVSLVPATFQTELVRLWRPAALEPVRHSVLLVRATSDDTFADELELLTLIELAARLPQYEHQARSASLLRRVFAASSTSEGFRSWRALRLIDGGYGTADPALKLRYYHQALLEELRLVAALSVHGRGMALAEAEALFFERGFLVHPQAAAEARRIAIDPGVASAALGRLLLEELSRDYRRAFPLSAEDELQERVLSEALVPVRLIRSRLLGPGGHDS